MKNLDLKARQQGMTLIELMIALLIGVFLLAGIMQVFVSSQQNYRIQDNLSRIQENGRFAIEFIGRDIRMADYWGCVSNATVNVQNKLNVSATFDSYTNGIAGEEDDNGGNNGDANNDENGNSIWDGTDSITLRGALGNGVNLTALGAGKTEDFIVNAGSSLSQNDLVVISNCTSGDIFQVTNNVDGGVSVAHGNGNVGQLGNRSTSLGYAPAAPGADLDENVYGSEAQIYKLKFATYRIQNNAGDPVLFRSMNGAAFQGLIDGIENMQILYGEDTDADGSPNYYVDADSISDMNQVTAIRISLLVRSIEDNLTLQPRSYSYLGVNITPTDRRLRRVFTTTINLRNRRV